MIDEGKPLFAQIAEQVEDQILNGALAEQERAPSTNELAAFYRINPATAAKGVNVLVEKGVLYKQRGIGMFVAEGARRVVLNERREAFIDRFIEPLIREAYSLGFSGDELAQLISDHAKAAPTAGPTSQTAPGATPSGARSTETQEPSTPEQEIRA